MNTMMENNFVARQIANERIQTAGREPVVLAYPTKALRNMFKSIMDFIHSMEESMQPPMLASMCTLAEIGC